MDGKDLVIVNQLNGIEKLCALFNKVNGKLVLLSLGCAAYVIYAELNYKKQKEEIERLNRELKELKDPKGE